MKINGVHHIAIICSDYQISKKFYTDVLGFRIIKETYRADRRSFKLDLEICGEYKIELFSFPDCPERVTNPEATGLRHLAFKVDNVNEAVDYLRSKDIDVEEIRTDQLSGKRFVFLRDPDDLPLELYEQ